MFYKFDLPVIFANR